MFDVGDARSQRPPELGGGRFLVCAPLGDGGAAGVFLAWDRQREGWVAIKVMLSGHMSDPHMLGRFRSEAEAMMRLRHPHIPEVYAHDMEALPPYLAMELARCGSAMSWISEHGPMPPSLAVDVLVQMCAALDHAHTNGIIHRDVKPHNFLLNDGGRFKLTDFGIARLGTGASMTATGSQLGTFSFMAPEQRSDTKTVDKRADVYALGASLYTMLTGRTSAELFIAEDEPSLLAEVPEPFRPVIIRACAYRPADRYESVLQTQGALLSALARFPSADLAHPPLVSSDPLPSRPPEVVPRDHVFDDLMAALTGDHESTSLDSWPTQTDSVELLRSPMETPVYRPRQPDPPSSPSGLPSYLDPSERDQEMLRESARAASRAVFESTIEVGPPAAEPDERPWVEWSVYGMVAVAMAATLFVIGSAGWVGMGRRHMDGAADVLGAALLSESAVVYELGRDRRFEELFVSYEEALGEARTEAAVDFADELHEALQDQRVPLAAPVQARVDRILAARDAYAEARLSWEHRAETLPGSVAVSIGIVRGP